MSDSVNPIDAFDSQFDGETNLRDSIIDLIESEYVNVPDARKVSDDVIFSVAERALGSAESLEPESRYFAVLREVSGFLTLSSLGERPNGDSKHTDLLPVGHPLSTAAHTLTASALRAERAAWISSDLRIESDEVRSVVASAYSTNPLSVDHFFAVARLNALSHDDVPRDIVLNPILAAGNPYAGKNSPEDRAARAEEQRRDRFGRFAYEGGGVRFYLRDHKGGTRSVVGKYAGNGTDPNFAQIEISGVDGVKDGIYPIPTNAMEYIKAVLPEDILPGVTPIAPPTGVPVVDISSLKRSSFPTGWGSTSVAANPTNVVTKVSPDASLASRDGYQVSKFNGQNEDLLTRIGEAAKTGAKTIGSLGTNALTPGLPVYEVVSSKDGSQNVIGYGQDWNAIQKLTAEEDRKYPLAVNEAPAAEPIATLPTSQAPAADQMMDDDPEPDEAPEAPVDYRATAPKGWKEDGDSGVFTNPEYPGFKVAIGKGFMGYRTTTFTDTNGNEYPMEEPVYVDNVLNVLDSNYDPALPRTSGSVFNWDAAADLVGFEDNAYIQDHGRGGVYDTSVEPEAPEFEPFDADFNPDDFQDVDEMVDELSDWSDNPSLSEKSFDKMTDESGLDAIKDILNPAKFVDSKDSDPIDVIKSILFPNTAFDGKAPTADEMADEDVFNAEELTKPTPHFLNRSDAGNNPSSGQLKRLAAVYTARKHTSAMQDVAEDMLQNPQNYTVAQLNSFVARLEKMPLEPKGPNGYPLFKATKKQREVLEKQLKFRDIPAERKAEISKNLRNYKQVEASKLIEEINDTYPMLERKMTVKDVSEQTGLEPEPKYLHTALDEDQNPPSKAQMVMMEGLLENREIPQAERDYFQNNFEEFSGNDYRELIDTFSDYPFKDKYTPEGLYTNMGDNGATPRQLKSFERIFSKGLVSPADEAALREKIPFLTRKQVGPVLGPLKKLEDAFDIEAIDAAIKDGASLDGLRVPENFTLTPDQAAVADIIEKDGERQVVYKGDGVSDDQGVADEVDEKAEAEALAKYQDARARRNDARRMRRAILKATGALADELANPRVSNKARHMLESAIQDLMHVKNAIDLRRKDPFSPERVDAALATIRDGLLDKGEAHTYGSLANASQRLLGIMSDASEEVHNLIGFYQAGQPRIYSADEMQDDALDGWKEIEPDLWKSSDGRYTVGFGERLGHYLLDGEDLISKVSSWKGVSDTIFYNENIRDLPGFTFDMTNPDGPNYDIDAWRVEDLLDPADADEMADEEDKVPDLGYIDPASFYGPALDWLKNVKDYNELMTFVNNSEFYLFDFETTGLFNLAEPHIKNDPVQVAVVKVVNGQAVDRLNLYMNPGSPLSTWSAKNLKNNDGVILTPDFLEQQLSKKEAMKKFLEFVPQGAILAGHNSMIFDVEILNRTLKEANLPTFKTGGTIDTLGLARYVMAKKSEANPDGPERHTLGALTSYFGIDTGELHNALADTEATLDVLKNIIQFGIDGKAKGGPEFDYKAASNKFNFPFYKAKVATYKKLASEYLAKQFAKDAASGRSVNVDDYVKFLTYPYNATGGSSAGNGVLADTVGGEDAPQTAASMGAPTEKQLASLERRLNTPGVFPEGAANRIRATIPTLTKDTIGQYIELADYHELMKRMRNGEPLDGVRIQPWFPGISIEQLSSYVPTVNLDGTPFEAKPLSPDEMIDEDDTSLADIDKVVIKKEWLPKGVKKLTKEQERIVKAALRGDNTVVVAMAGVGKTFSMEVAAHVLANAKPDEKIVYIVFNNSVKEEAERRMPSNVEVRTSDSISVKSAANAALYDKFTKMSKQQDPNNIPVDPEVSIALYDYFYNNALKEAMKTEPDREKAKASDIVRKWSDMKGQEAWDLVKAASDAVTKFAISGDDEILDRHIPWTKEDSKDENGKTVPGLDRKEILALAKEIWSDILSPHDPERQQIMPDFTHMFKNFALTNPNLRAVNGYNKSIHGFEKGAPSIMFLDEAQDINQVFFTMIQQQNDLHNNGLQYVAVGDPNQSLYEFRGAVNILDKVRRNITLPLSQSFRFGQAVADVANKVLDLRVAKKGDKTAAVRLIGNPDMDTKIVETNSMQDYDAALVFTNSGALEAIAVTAAMRPDAKIGTTRAFKSDLELFIKTARWLKTPVEKRDLKYKPRKFHPNLRSFDTWKEVEQEFEAHGSPNLSRFRTILMQTGKRIGATNDWMIFKELEKIASSLRIKTKGFNVPNEPGRAGELGNLIDYRVEKGKLIIFNHANRPDKTMRPNQGTGNFRDSLLAQGFTKPFGVYHYEAPLRGNSVSNLKAQLEDLVHDMSGENIDVTVITAHRGKGLEYKKVRIWKDAPKPGEKEPETAEQASNPEEFRKLNNQSLNAIYVAITRAEEELDLGGAEWVTKITKDELFPDLKAEGEDSDEMLDEDLEDNDTYNYRNGWESGYVGDSRFYVWRSPDDIYTAIVQADTTDAEEYSLSKLGRIVARGVTRFPGGIYPHAVHSKTIYELRNLIEGDVRGRKLAPHPDEMADEDIPTEFGSQALENVSPDEAIKPADGTPGSDSEPVNEPQSAKVRTRNQEVTDSIVNDIIAQMDKGIIPWRQPWSANGFLPTSGATGRVYRGLNLVRLMTANMQYNYEGNRWYTKNAINKLGGYLEKDAKGIPIAKVTMLKKDVDQEVRKPNPEKPGEFLTVREKVTRNIPRLDYDYVYNEGEIRGVELPAQSRKEPPAASEVEKIVLESYKDGPEIKHVAGDSAHWNPATDTVVLPLREQFSSVEDYLDTLFHELTHSTGHENRLDRKDLTKDYGTHKDQRAREELIAEIGGAILSQIFNIDATFDNNLAYVQSWSQFLKEDPNALHEAASLASKAAEYILGGYWASEEGLVDLTNETSARPTEAIDMAEGAITGEPGTSGGLGNGVNYRIEDNSVILMGNTKPYKDVIKSVSVTPAGRARPFHFIFHSKNFYWFVSLGGETGLSDRMNILEQLKNKISEQTGEAPSIAPTADEMKDSDSEKKNLEPNSRLYAVNAAAAEFFKQNLMKNPAAKPAVDLLLGRNFTKDTAEKFELGYAPKGWSNLLNHLRNLGFSEKEMNDAGLVGFSEKNGTYYDLMRNRVIWPIKDASGNVVGFNGRRIDDTSNDPKYINTKTTDVYKKSDTLYNLDRAKDAIKSSGQAIVVEGFTDLMALDAAGIQNVVASAGTAFGPGHVKTLNDTFGDSLKEVVFSFDPDEAGKNAAMKVAEKLTDLKADPYVVFNKEGLDPAEVFAKYGAEGLKDVAKDKQPLIDFALERLLSSFDLTTAAGRYHAIEAASNMIASIDDAGMRQSFITKLAELVGKDITRIEDAVNQKMKWRR